MSRVPGDAATVVLLAALAVVACRGGAGHAAPDKVVDRRVELIPSSNDSAGQGRWWIELLEPARHLDLAHERLAHHDSAATAAELRAAAGFLRSQAIGPGDGSRSRLWQEVQDLRRLASRLERRVELRLEDLDHALARANLALAQHYRVRADSLAGTTSLRGRRLAVTEFRESINSAAAHLQRAARLTGQPDDTAVARVVEEVHALNRQLVLEPESIPGGSQPVLYDIQRQIERLSIVARASASVRAPARFAAGRSRRRATRARSARGR